jgi:peptidoglycan/xylan/chitin deacetylase (PgdA/CDA1 family)
MKLLNRPEITAAQRYIFMVSLFIIILAILNAPPLPILSANPGKPVNAIAINVPLSSSVHQQTRPSRKELKMLEVQSIAQEYMQALLDQQYSLMWSLLHPQVQAKWPNERAFETFWQTRFKEYTLQGFKLGNMHELPYWVDPETMIQYTQLEEIPVSLKLIPKVKSFQGSPLPPEDLHPSQLFQNLPIIMQYTGNLYDKRGNWFILDGGPADLEAPILPPITPINKIIQVPILMYHHISPFFSAYPLSGYFRRWVVPPESFSLQMDYLKMHNYHTITFNQFFDAMYYGGPLPTKPIILTFDDGDADQYQYAYPILWAHHFSAMFYIITGWVGQADSMTWSQLGEMLAHGMQMGSHTVHHADLKRLLYISEDAVQRELQQSQFTLEKEFRIVIQQFCYPYGDPFNRGTWLQREKIMAMLDADGYIGATTAFGMTGSMQGSMYPLALLRIPVYGNEWFQWFVASLPW